MHVHIHIQLQVVHIHIQLQVVHNMPLAHIIQIAGGICKYNKNIWQKISNGYIVLIRKQQPSYTIHKT